MRHPWFSQVTAHMIVGMTPPPTPTPHSSPWPYLGSALFIVTLAVAGVVALSINGKSGMEIAGIVAGISALVGALFVALAKLIVDTRIQTQILDQTVQKIEQIHSNTDAVVQAIQGNGHDSAPH